MRRNIWVQRYRADMDMMVEAMNQLRARKKEYIALALSTDLVDEDCGDTNKIDVIASITTWDEIEALLTNQKFATLIRVRQ